MDRPQEHLTLSREVTVARILQAERECDCSASIRLEERLLDIDEGPRAHGHRAPRRGGGSPVGRQLPLSCGEPRACPERV